MAHSITASRMFMRSGLIRKDLLPYYCSEGDHPETAVVTSVKELESFFDGKENDGGR